MKNLSISDGWFKKEEPKEEEKKTFCEHKANTVTIDFEYGIEHCSFCGALGHYNIDTDSVEWKLPEYLTRQNYN